jgi:uncharacterized protein with FMN-binding domain
MRRAPYVITGTVVGLAAVLSFRSTPATISLGALNSGAGAAASASAPTTTAGASPPTTSPATTTPTTKPTAAAAPTTVRATVTTRPTTTVAPPTTAAASVRSATGPSVDYFFGNLSVKVTVSGSKITAVSIASLSDGGNPRSQYIDQQALPLLIQQALAAQSASIQGVSGASYTTQGFDQSLQGALKQLGV